MKPSFKLFSKANILPCAVLCISLINLCGQSPGFDNPSFYISLVGLLSVALFVLHYQFNRVLFYLWAIVQLVVVRHGSFNAGTVAVAAPNLTGGFNLPLFLPVKLGTAGYQPGINLTALFLLAMMVVTRPKNLIGCSLSFSAYRHDNSLGIVFPLKGKAERYVTLLNEKDWLLVNLTTPFTYKNELISYALIRRNDKQPIIKNRINQLVFFKPVADIKMVAEDGIIKSGFEDEVWALCK